MNPSGNPMDHLPFELQNAIVRQLDERDLASLAQTGQNMAAGLARQRLSDLEAARQAHTDRLMEEVYDTPLGHEVIILG